PRHSLPYQHFNRIADFRGIVEDIGLPHSQDVPSGPRKFLGYIAVSLAIPSDFRNPVRRVVPSQQEPREPRPMPAMPKVAVAENSDLCFLEHHIRVARQVIGIRSVLKPTSC